MFDPVDKVIAAIGRGEIVVITDDENRENEGDVVMAAEKATDQAINFMITHGRGLLCTTLVDEQIKRLGLTPMPPKGSGDAFGTAFMESVDAAEGVSTGISAHDRAETIRVLVNPSSSSSDLVSPGHTFPLAAVSGGVLQRAGHTEASVDLARMAGLAPAGVICEVLREDGHMARLPELREFAKQHGLLMTSIADLIAYRRQTEKLIEFVREVELPTRHGTFSLRLYHSLADGEHHIALVMGDVTTEEPVLARVHSECLTGDVLGSQRCDCGNQLHEAMEMIAKEVAKDLEGKSSATVACRRTR
jgi:3,4-dihydroxy 2-butanone 4-phosphate synthase/GTP cyclohydrolase II